MLNLLLFLVCCIAGVFLTFVSTPAFAFVLYEVIYFMYPENRHWGSMLPNISFSFYTVILMFIGLIYSFKESKKNPIFSPPQMKWVYFILLGYGLTSFWAVLPEHHHNALTSFFKLVIIISIAYKLIDTIAKLDYAIWGYLFGCWYLGFVTFQTGRNSGTRVEGIGTVDATEANGIAALIAPSIVMLLYYFWISKAKWQKVIFIIGGVFVANAIVLINSRGSFLAVVASVGYFMLYMYFSKHKVGFQKMTAVVITTVGLSGVVYLADDTFMDRLYTMTETKVDVEKQSGSTRTIFWSSAWEMTKDYPAGLGAHGFNYYAPLYIPEEVNVGGRGRNRTVHSTWFEALTELGYYGLFCLIGLLSATFFSTRACKKALIKKEDFENYYKIIAIEAMLISFIVAATFINRFRAEALYWLILYSACAYNIFILRYRNVDDKTS